MISSTLVFAVSDIDLSDEDIISSHSTDNFPDDISDCKDCSTLDNISSDLSQLEVTTQIRTNPPKESTPEQRKINPFAVKVASIRSAEPPKTDSRDTLAVPSKESRSTKRNLNGSAEQNPGPSKKVRSSLSMLPTAAEVVKMEDAHVVDVIPNNDGKETFTKEELKSLKNSFNRALFGEEAFASIHFEFSGPHRGRYRLVCKDTFTKEWVGANLSTIVSGPPPRLTGASISLEVPTLEPDDLFKIIATQNPDINTSSWRFFNKGKISRGKQIWAIGIDIASIKALKKIGFRPYCGMNRLKIVVPNALE